MSTNHEARFQNLEQSQGSTLRLTWDNYVKQEKHFLRVCPQLHQVVLNNAESTKPLW